MSDAEFVLAWRPPVPGVREVLHARFHTHVYPPHTHGFWTVIVVDDGDIRFTLDGRLAGSSTTTVTVLPPHVVHDGRAGATGGFVKRVLYLDEDFLGAEVIGHAVDRPTLRDGRLRHALASVHTTLRQPGEELQAETFLAMAGHRVAACLGAGSMASEPAAPHLAEATRALLDEHIRRGITLHDIASRLHASPGHVARTFTSTFAISPHRYLVGRRIDRSRTLLLDGWPTADVATATGFHDQAHFTRHFRRHVGTTPARYREGSRRLRVTRGEGPGPRRTGAP